MGYAIAGELARRGAEVTLVSGRTSLDVPTGVERVGVLSADEMYDAAVEAFKQADGAVMCAAVADYTPAEVADRKLQKGDGELTLALKRTRDIAAALATGCWSDSPWKRTTNRLTPKPNCTKRTSTSSC